MSFFGCRPYNGENSLIMNGASPKYRRVTCDHCKGEGVVYSTGEDGTIQEDACEECGGEGYLEIEY